MSAARPETGATEQQIKEAKETVRRLLEATTMSTNEVRFVVKHTKHFAAAIVPPTHVIALAEHVVSAADREAIGYAFDALSFAAAALEDEEMSAEELRKHLFEFVHAAHCTEYLARLERLGSGGEESK